MNQERGQDAVIFAFSDRANVEAEFIDEFVLGQVREGNDGDENDACHGEVISFPVPDVWMLSILKLEVSGR